MPSCRPTVFKAVFAVISLQIPQLKIVKYLSDDDHRMERKIYAELMGWKNDPDRKPMILLGCRQVGKTFIVREFGDREYGSTVYLNFADNPDDRLLFRGNLDADRLADRIIVSKNLPAEGRTLLVLDEIQECDDAYYSLKPLSSKGRFDIIATGSFLGVTLESGKKDDSGQDEHRVSPMGYACVKRMYPMDFEEFLWAMGVNRSLISDVKKSVTDGTEIDQYYHRTLSDLFRRYLVVGGMPAAVKAYSETGDYAETVKRLDEIVAILRIDAGKYSPKSDVMRIQACLQSIPSQLAGGNRSFQYYDIEKKKGTGKREYGTALEWLENAGIALRCRNLLSVDPPLDNNVDGDAFKMYLCDTGILMSLCGYRDVQEIVAGDPFTNNGMLMENATADALASKGYPLYYYAKKDSTLEVDFVLKYKGKVCIAEIKSGKHKRSRSLSMLLSEKNRNRMGLKVCDNNVMTDVNGVMHLPLYGPSFLEGPEVPRIARVDVDEINRRYSAGKA